MLTVIFEPKVKQVIQLSPEQMKNSWAMASSAKTLGRGAGSCWAVAAGVRLTERRVRLQHAA